MHRSLVIAALAACSTLALAPDAVEAQRVITRRSPPPPRTPPRTTTRVVTQPRRGWEPVASRQMTLAVGVLRYRPDGDDNHPMASLRADWRLRSWLRSELGVSYAMAELDIPTEGGLVREDVSSHLLTGTVGLLAEAPFPYFRPYVGAAAGLSARFDGEGDEEDEEGGDAEGDHFVRPMMAFPVGIRIPITPRFGLRAEARFRFDENRDGRSATNVEQTVGVSFGF